MKKFYDTWQVVVLDTCQLGEGPLWDPIKGCLFWLDILAGEIHQLDPVKNKHRTFRVGSMVGSIALRAAGGIIAALRSGFTIIDLDTSESTFIHHPEPHLPGNRFNDGKCDAAGRFWAGTMSVYDTPGAGALYTLEPDHSVRIKIEGVSCSNGLAWSPDNQTFYYIDTPSRQVVAYDHDPESGDISNKRTVIEIPAREGLPDGMTIDNEGMLWIAMWQGWQVARWDPRTGKMLKRIRLPVAKITSCTFGGERLGDLYITSARAGLTEEEQKNQPLAGSLFIVKNCGHQGIPAFQFRG